MPDPIERLLAALAALEPFQEQLKRTGKMSGLVFRAKEEFQDACRDGVPALRDALRKYGGHTYECECGEKAQMPLRLGHHQGQHRRSVMVGKAELLIRLDEMEGRAIAAEADLARLRDERDAALAGQAELREALGNLLDDSQHKDHDCGDEEICPVAQGRQAWERNVAGVDFLERHRAALAALRGCEKAMQDYCDKFEWYNSPAGVVACEVTPWRERFLAALSQARSVQGVTP